MLCSVCRYDFGNVKESKLKSYTSNDIPKLIKKGVRKLRKRKGEFCSRRDDEGRRLGRP